MKYLLDTDHLTFFELGGGIEYSRIQRRMALVPRRDVACAIVSLHEQFLGCHAFLANARNEAKLLRGYELLRRIFDCHRTMDVLPFERAAYLEYARLQAIKPRIGTMDLRIAATALAHGLILVTRNTVDFARIPGLVLEDWTI